MPNYSLHELCRLSGVKRKALLVYEEKGLLSPVERKSGEYRYYDEEAVARLYKICAFKEMGFKLREVHQILDDPTIDRRKIIEQQIDKMEQQKAKLDMLIGFAKTVVAYGILPLPKMGEGEYPLAQFLREFIAESNFDNMATDMKELQEKEPEVIDRLNAIFDELTAMSDRGESPESKTVQMKVKELRKYIFEHVQKTPIEGFRGIADILVSGGAYDEMMREEFSEKAIDFIARAIHIYCDRVENKREHMGQPIELTKIFKGENKT